MGYDKVYSCESFPTFRKNPLPLSSGQNTKPGVDTEVLMLGNTGQGLVRSRPFASLYP